MISLYHILFRHSNHNGSVGDTGGSFTDAGAVQGMQEVEDVEAWWDQRSGYVRNNKLYLQSYLGGSDKLNTILAPVYM